MIQRSELRTVDVVTALFLAGSALLALAWWPRLDGSRWLIPLYLAGAGLAVTVPPLLRRNRRPAARFLASWYPLFCFLFFYKGTALLNAASPVPSLDPWLYRVDLRLFGDAFCRRFSSGVPLTLFAEIMAFFYFSYYLMIPGMALWLWVRDRTLFHRFVCAVTFSFYSFYIFFSLFPSGGPQFYLAGGAITWRGYVFGPLLTGLLRNLEVSTGAFPSSHAGVGLVVAAFAWRLGRREGVAATLALAGLSTAVLYGGPHYFIDLPLGLAVGGAWYLLAAPVERGMEAFLGTGPLHEEVLSHSWSGKK